MTCLCPFLIRPPRISSQRSAGLIDDWVLVGDFQSVKGAGGQILSISECVSSDISRYGVAIKSRHRRSSSREDSTERANLVCDHPSGDGGRGVENRAVKCPWVEM
jgi:hypothetical protein